MQNVMDFVLITIFALVIIREGFQRACIRDNISCKGGQLGMQPTLVQFYQKLYTDEGNRETKRGKRGSKGFAEGELG